eukprot:superscaffoldBa00010759_g24872
MTRCSNETCAFVSKLPESEPEAGVAYPGVAVRLVHRTPGSPYAGVAVRLARGRGRRTPGSPYAWREALFLLKNFRCDCGNRKFTELQCKLFPDKEVVNSLNKYSHNFFGEYCTCSRPYPDPDDQVEDEMIQCVVCEDWLHGRHLGCVVPDCVELQEMICESCMNKNPFLWTFAAHLAVPGESVEEEVKEETAGSDELNMNLNQSEKVDDVIEPSCKRSRRETEPSCRLKELEAAGQKRVQSGAVFWPSAWRSKLCSCSSCQESLSEAGLSFLLDELDTVLAYENKGKNSEQRQPGHDPLMSALDNLNRVQQLEIIHGN